MKATIVAQKKLDESFFRVRYDQCSSAEKDYMRALAELGKGTYNATNVPDQLDCEGDVANEERSSLIKKGMIYSTVHGEACFTVPMFDAFMRREIPDFVAKS